MCKNIIYTIIGVVIVFIATCSIYFIQNPTNTVHRSCQVNDYSNIKVKKARPKKFNKRNGKIFKCKKDEKLYAVFRRYKDSSKPKELLFVFTKGSFSDNGKGEVNFIREVKIEGKPGIIFKDSTDVNAIIKRKDNAYYNGKMIRSHVDDNSLLEHKFK